MTILNLPAKNSSTIFDAIVGRKRKQRRTILQNLTNSVHTAYGTYQLVNLPALAPIVVGKLQSKALLHCYTSSTKELAEMRQELLDAAGSYCPYCLLDRPTTLDHYLPKDTFPEFSVYRLNLVPSCDNCNRVKDVLYSENGARLFVHCFLDQLPNDCFALRAEVVWVSDTPRFRFFIADEDDCLHGLRDLLLTHLDRLGLTDWYAKRSSEDFTAAVDSVIKQVSNDNLRARLNERIIEARKLHGPLAWQAAMWAAVLDDAAAFELLRCGAKRS